MMLVAAVVKKEGVQASSSMAAAALRWTPPTSPQPGAKRSDRRQHQGRRCHRRPFGKGKGERPVLPSACPRLISAVRPGVVTRTPTASQPERHPFGRPCKPCRPCRRAPGGVLLPGAFFVDGQSGQGHNRPVVAGALARSAERGELLHWFRREM